MLIFGLCFVLKSKTRSTANQAHQKEILSGFKHNNFRSKKTNLETLGIIAFFLISLWTW